MKRYVIALGGNALLRRGEPLTAHSQRANAAMAARALAPFTQRDEVIITHGNGPQVGLLALQSAAYRQDLSQPLDVLDAETEGQIGYLIEQELLNALPDARRCAAILTQIEVASDDPAFHTPTKPIGPLYDERQANEVSSQRGWTMARGGDGFRRVVPSPRPKRIVELGVIQLLVRHGVVVICAGGGGIPVIRRDDGSLMGVEAVIDKDLASALLARELKADGLLLLTDVDAVYTDWGKSSARAIRSIAPDAIHRLPFEAGTMAPKVAAAREFVTQGGSFAGIGRLQDADDILAGKAGTRVTAGAAETVWWN